FDGRVDLIGRGLLVIHIDVNAVVTQSKHLIESGHLLAGILCIELAPGIQALDGGEVQIAHSSFTVGGAIHTAVMHDDQPAVFGGANIQFDVIDAKFDGVADGAQRV